MRKDPRFKSEFIRNHANGILVREKKKPAIKDNIASAGIVLGAIVFAAGLVLGAIFL